MRNFKYLKLTNGVLIRQTLKNVQIVLPQEYHKIVYIGLHENMAHLGSEKVVELAQQRFYWPYMGKDIKNYIQKKCRCVVSKKPNIQERAPLVPTKATYPFEMISIDFLHLDKCKGGFEYALVVCDHFILQYGFPKRVHHDRGAEFNSNLFKELHRLSGIKSSNTTPYHPMGDGQVERMNRTLCNMLKSLPENGKHDWKKYLQKLAFAYNSTINKSTGFSPFFLMFGRQSRLAIDSIFQTDTVSPDLKNQTHKQFVNDWRSSMEEAFEIANMNIKKSSTYNKHHHDKKVKEIEIRPGDKVLIRNMKEKGGTGKLKSYWEHEVYKVIKRDEKLPVYTLQNLNRNVKRLMHRNILMKCNDLPLEMFEDEMGNNNKPKKHVPTKPEAANESFEEFEDDDDIELIIHEEETPIFVQRGRGKDEKSEESEAIANHEMPLWKR